jgi:hypothetical protein
MPSTPSTTLSGDSNSNSNSSSSSSSSSECPNWFQEYLTFHQEYRGRPDAKYLVVECNYGGLGDRLNGALVMLRAAAATKRVVLLQMPKPYPLEELFEPSGPVNWTIKGLKLPHNGARWELWLNLSKFAV